MLTAVNEHQPSFQAKLNIRGFKLPHNAEISEEFANITKRYDNDVLSISVIKTPMDNGTFSRNTYFTYNRYIVGTLPKLKDFKNFCKERTPKQVAKSLAKVFKLGKLNVKTAAEFSKMEEELKYLSSATASIGLKFHSMDFKILKGIMNTFEQETKTFEKRILTTRANYDTKVDRIKGKDPLFNIIDLINKKAP